MVSPTVARNIAGICGTYKYKFCIREWILWRIYKFFTNTFGIICLLSQEMSSHCSCSYLPCNHYSLYLALILFFWSNNLDLLNLCLWVKYTLCRPTFITIYKKKKVEEYKADPYLATVLNCALWVFYGLPMVHPDSLLVITINGTGLAIEMLYLAIFFYYSPTSRKVYSNFQAIFCDHLKLKSILVLA